MNDNTPGLIKTLRTAEDHSASESDESRSYRWTEVKGITLGLSCVRATPEYSSAYTEAEYVKLPLA